MEIRWYDVNIDPMAKVDTLLEKPSKHGKYGRRDDLEPILRKYNKENKDLIKFVRDLKYNVQTFRSQFSKYENEGMLTMCDSVLTKIDSHIA